MEEMVIIKDQNPMGKNKEQEKKKLIKILKKTKLRKS